MRLTSRTILALAAALTINLSVPAQTTTPAKPRVRTAASTSAKSKPASTPVTPTSTAPCACAATTVPPRPQNIKPYTLKQQTTRVQTLADGTQITTIEDLVSARDADGRTYRESTRTLNGEVLRSYSIYDYPTQTTYSWNDGPNYVKVATVSHPRPVQTPPTAQPVPVANARRYYPTSTQTLPPQTINGIYVEGSRNTRTIPAGYEGNDHDLTITSEYWRSPDLGITVRYITDDPRSGKSTTETTDIQQSADPSLFRFQLPAGYTLRENNPQ